jgi:polyphosphate kinase 2 (PPK2 family)
MLRAQLNTERFRLEQGKRKEQEIADSLSQQQQWNAETQSRIDALTETLDAAGASSEPWPNTFEASA